MYDIPEHWGATPFKRMWKSLLHIIKKKKHPKKRNMATKVINYFFIKFISQKGNFGKGIAKRRRYTWVVLNVLVG